MNETAKKILGFINRLPETWDGQPLRQQALDNFDEKFASDATYTEINFIKGAFNWRKTPEKDDYWCEIYYLIMNGTIQLLPEEKKDEFVWDDNLVMEFALQTKVNGTKDWVCCQIEQFKASKQRKPLFVTEDGVEVFSGDIYFLVDTSWLLSRLKSRGNYKEYEGKYFSTEAAAREYVRLNKPMYSLNDVEVASNKIGSNPDEIFSLKIELEKLKQ